MIVLAGEKRKCENFESGNDEVDVKRYKGRFHTFVLFLADRQGDFLLFDRSVGV